jgi:hypothetical protein
MAGTMLLLSGAGYDLHYLTIANGGCGGHGQKGEGMPMPMLVYCSFEPYTDTIFISGQRMAQTPAHGEA